MSTVDIHGRTYEIVPITDMTFGEQRELKKATNGMSVAAIERGVEELDADACYGMLLVSIRRVDPTFDHRKLLSLNMVDLVESIIDDQPEEVAEPVSVPPPVAAEATAPAAPVALTTPPTESAGAETPGPSGTPV